MSDYQTYFRQQYQSIEAEPASRRILREAAMIKHEEAEYGMKRGGKVKKMASGGFVKSADGIAKKGKTKGTQITMKRGGKC